MLMKTPKLKHTCMIIYFGVIPRYIQHRLHSKKKIPNLVVKNVNTTRTDLLYRATKNPF